MPIGKRHSRSGKKFSLLPPMPKDERFSDRASDASRTSALAPAPESSKLSALQGASFILLGHRWFCKGDATQQQQLSSRRVRGARQEESQTTASVSKLAGQVITSGIMVLTPGAEQEQGSPAMASAKNSTARTDKMLTNFIAERLGLHDVAACSAAMCPLLEVMPLCCLLCLGYACDQRCEYSRLSTRLRGGLA